MRSGRATVGEPRKNDDLERTRDQKRRSNSLSNVDPEPIGDRTRTEEPGLVTSRPKANSTLALAIIIYIAVPPTVIKQATALWGGG